MKAPVKRKPGGRIVIDVLAARQAIYTGNLTAADRRTIDSILPGVCQQIDKDAAALRLNPIQRENLELVCEEIANNMRQGRPKT